MSATRRLGGNDDATVLAVALPVRERAVSGLTSFQETRLAA